MEVNTSAVEEAPSIRRHTFIAMGTRVSVMAPVLADRRNFGRVVGGVESCFREYEARFSRFRETSELSRVNAGSGSWTSVSEDFMSILQEALDGARRTEGLFDPTALPALMAAGYDRDFDDVIAGAREALRTRAPCGRWTDIQQDGDRIRLPRDVALDLGGIAKGWTVDVAVERTSELLPWVIVEAGGDLRLGGNAGVRGLDISIEDPYDPAVELLRLRLLEGSLATSSVTRRAWGLNLHHIINPRTGEPARTGVVQATSWAPTCSQAEIGSTWALLAGRSVLDRLPATLVLEDGTVVTNMPYRDRALGAGLSKPYPAVEAEFGHAT